MTNTLDTNTVRFQKTQLTLPAEVYSAFASLSGDTETRNTYLTFLRELGWTLQSISDASGITRERVRQIVAGAEVESFSPIAVLPQPLPPVFETKAPRQYVEPDPAKLARLLELQPLARKSRGTGSAYQSAGDEYTALVAEVHLQDGVPLYRLAKRLGVTHGALRSRLGRFGYKLPKESTNKIYALIQDESRRAN